MAMKIFASDLGFPEAPVLLPDESFLFVEMAPDKGCVTWISKDGASRRTVAKTGRPNGLARDRDGFIWVAETAQRALLKLTLDGDYETIATNFDGEEFLFLNDLALGPDGRVYLTDSGIAMEEFAPGGELNPDWESLSYDGRVYRIDPDTREVDRLDNGIRFTNGLAFDSDGHLYVAETLTGNIFKYVFENNEYTGVKQPFGNVINPEAPEGIKGPDGMKFGKDGKLYVAVFGQGDVTVLGPDGAVVTRYEAGGIFPTNLVFGKDGEESIYLTEVETGTVRIIDVGTDGLPLHG
jgi:gluconolactonase